MSTYTVVSGDTFDLIARKKYGTEKESGFIARANPGVAEPLTPGTNVNIPDLPGAPRDVVQQTVSDNIDEVAISIEGKRFRYWTNVRITRAIDNMDTVEFSAPFDAKNPELKKTFRPFSFKSVEITIGGVPFFTGTMVGVRPKLDNNKRTVDVSAYSKPGVLNDCTMPASAYPIEYNNQGLTEIAATMAAPFGISVEFQADQGAIFEQVASDTGERVLKFLQKLAKQRNLVISSTPLGALLFLQSADAGQPVAQFVQGEPPVTGITPFFNEQEFYSHVTGLEPMLVGLAGSSFVVSNPRLKGVTRPITFKVPDTEGADIKAAVEAKAGRMFGNAVAYAVEVPTWRDSKGNLWQPNSTIHLIAPDMMIYTEYAFIVRSVEFNRDRKSTTAILTLVIPGAFSGKIPETLPWD